MNLAIIAQDCNSSEKLLEFIKLLSEGFKNNKEEWQNTNICDFLESALAWVEDTGKSHVDYSEHNPWGSIAKLLYMGKIYE